MKFDLDPGFGLLPSAFEHGFRDACLRVSFLFVSLILFLHCVFNGACLYIFADSYWSLFFGVQLQ